MKIPRYLFSYFCSKILSSYLYDMLKPSKTTSPQKPFPSDCITLYIQNSFLSAIACIRLYKTCREWGANKDMKRGGAGLWKTPLSDSFFLCLFLVSLSQTLSLPTKPSFLPLSRTISITL